MSLWQSDARRGKIDINELVECKFEEDNWPDAAPLLVWATIVGLDKLVYLLLEHVDEFNPPLDGRTLATSHTNVLHHASMCENERVMSLLFSRPTNLAVSSSYVRFGIDINARGYKGATALHTIAGNGNLDSLRMLLDAGANIHAERRRQIHTLASCCVGREV